MVNIEIFNNSTDYQTYLDILNSLLKNSSHQNNTVTNKEAIALNQSLYDYFGDEDFYITKETCLLSCKKCIKVILFHNVTIYDCVMSNKDNLIISISILSVMIILIILGIVIYKNVSCLKIIPSKRNKDGALKGENNLHNSRYGYHEKHIINKTETYKINLSNKHNLMHANLNKPKEINVYNSNKDNNSYFRDNFILNINDKFSLMNNNNIPKKDFSVKSLREKQKERRNKVLENKISNKISRNRVNKPFSFKRKEINEIDFSRHNIKNNEVNQVNIQDDKELNQMNIDISALEIKDNYNNNNFYADSNCSDVLFSSSNRSLVHNHQSSRTNMTVKTNETKAANNINFINTNNKMTYLSKFNPFSSIKLETIDTNINDIDNHSKNILSSKTIINNLDMIESKEKKENVNTHNINIKQSYGNIKNEKINSRKRLESNVFNIKNNIFEHDIEINKAVVYSEFHNNKEFKRLSGLNKELFKNNKNLSKKHSLFINKIKTKSNKVVL